MLQEESRDLKSIDFTLKYLQTRYNSEVSESPVQQRPFFLNRFIRKNVTNLYKSSTIAPVSLTNRLDTSTNNRNMTQTSIKARKFTLRQLQQMEKDIFVLTRNLKNNLASIGKGQKAKKELSDQPYRRFQRCSFFDRKAIQHPKKKQVQGILARKGENSINDSIISQDTPFKSHFEIFQGDVSKYMKTIIKTHKNKLNRFSIKLNQKIRSKFLKDIKEYNFSNIKKDIELSKINNDGLWIDQFDSLKKKLLNIQTNQETKYRRSICTRAYDPYLQYLAMRKSQRKMIKKTYQFELLSPKSILL